MESAIFFQMAVWSDDEQLFHTQGATIYNFVISCITVAWTAHGMTVDARQFNACFVYYTLRFWKQYQAPRLTKFTKSSFIYLLARE